MSTDVLLDAVCTLNDEEVRVCLERDPECVQRSPEGRPLLHAMLGSVPSSEVITSPGRRTVVYLLRNRGLDVNSQDQAGDTALHLALRRHGDTEICEALLQAGADIFLTNHEGISSLEYAMAHPAVPSQTKELLKKYKPGLWRAVQDDDLMAVRKLINLWCRVDLTKNERTLKQAVLDKGTEHIIRLIIDIAPSMHLAHSVMAGDIQAVQTACTSGAKINYNFKNLGDMGATPLFYAIMQNNGRLVQLLHDHGAKINTTITFDDQDIPLYFTALHEDIDIEIVKCLTPPASDKHSFIDLHYKGRNVIQYCIENQVPVQIIQYILLQGYPQLLSTRDRRNLCPREVAELMGRADCVSGIDQLVHDWFLDNCGVSRKVLSLNGYPYLREARTDGIKACEVILSMETSSEQSQFDSELQAYQEHICELHDAVEAGDMGNVRKLIQYTSSHPQCFHTSLANSCCKTDTQPLLHKAILRKHFKIAELLCQKLRNDKKLKIDHIHDAWYRTALHYAYGMPDAKELVYLLLDFGCSDFSMDKDGRSPLVFRDQRNHPQMAQLICYHITRDYGDLEPSPWLIGRIPLTGCSQQGHGHSHGDQSHDHHHHSSECVMVAPPSVNNPRGNLARLLGLEPVRCKFPASSNVGTSVAEAGNEEEEEEEEVDEEEEQEGEYEEQEEEGEEYDEEEEDSDDTESYDSGQDVESSNCVIL